MSPGFRAVKKKGCSDRGSYNYVLVAREGRNSFDAHRCVGKKPSNSVRLGPSFVLRSSLALNFSQPQCAPTDTSSKHKLNSFIPIYLFCCCCCFSLFKRNRNSVNYHYNIIIAYHGPRFTAREEIRIVLLSGIFFRNFHRGRRRRLDLLDRGQKKERSFSRLLNERVLPAIRRLFDSHVGSTPPTVTAARSSIEYIVTYYSV